MDQLEEVKLAIDEKIRGDHVLGSSFESDSQENMGS